MSEWLGTGERGRWTVAGGFVGEACGGVALWADLEVGLDVACVLVVEVLEERDAPAAASAGREALADERGNRGVLNLQKRPDLAERDVEAEADVVVWVHGGG